MLTEFRTALLAYRARSWAHWGTAGMWAEHGEFERALRAGQAVTLSANTVFMVLYAIGGERASLVAWGATATDANGPSPSGASWPRQRPK